MEFCLLGPLLVRRSGVAVPVAAGKQRSLLAALLLSANQVVPADQLGEALWGSEQPRTARASLQNTVLRLRRSLADAGQSRITAQPGGYQIRVESGELDVDAFEALLASARVAARAGAHSQAAALLSQALSLWRGQPLAGVPSESLALVEVPRLEEMRLQAVEARIDADLRTGRHAEVIAELRQLVAANPLRERLHALLMLALYEDGQQAQALAAYQSARCVLSAELGVEPGPKLRDLQRQVLTGKPAVVPCSGGPREATASARARPALAGATVPRQLPAAPPRLAGRVAELAALTRLANRAAGDAAKPIAVITGTAGVGKTALAVHWAHQVAGQFQDGQLYVNLRGFGPSQQPMTPAEAVRLFLDGLGVAPQRIPGDPQAQAALYRSMLAGKRLLVVLDNALDAAQVRPLLPGSPGCLVLVTSRRQLIGLVAAEGASLISLDVLSDPESREMLVLRLPRHRITAEPATAELIELCARLPLALSVAAAQTAALPGLPLASLVAQLRDARALVALATGDVATDVRTVLSWSCQQLSGPSSRMFRLIGLHPGPDITAPAAASLAAVSLPQARQAIGDLVSAHLITEHLPGRFAFHDLLRAYAAEQARGQDSDADRHAALHRVLGHYLHTASAASSLLSYRDAIALSPLRAGAVAQQFADRQQALAWFQAERQVLLAAARQAAGSGLGAHAWQLAWTMATFLDWFGYWRELVDTQRSAVAAAERLGDLAGQAEARRHLARGLLRQGAAADAITHLATAIELAVQAGDLVLQARIHHDLGGAYESQGRIHDALGHAGQARRLYRAAGHRWGEALALSGAGWSHAQLGDYRQALDLCGQAMAIFRELDIRLGQAATLDSLGYVHYQLGQHSEAIACYQGAIAVDGDAGDRRSRAEILIHLGDAQQAAGEPRAARQAWQEALAILQELDPSGAGRARARLTRHAVTLAAC